jgi:hypothetical protein
MSMAAPTVSKPPRVFLGLVEIAGYYASLAEGFRRLGISALQVTLRDHPYGYGTPPELPRIAHWLRGVVQRGDRASTPIARLTCRAARVPLHFMLLAWALPRFDVFMFGFGGSFLWGWDLPLLRLFGKRVVLIFHGSDSRPPYLDGVLSRGLDGNGLARAARRQARRVRRRSRHAHLVVDNPLSGHFQPGPFIPFQIVGRGVDAVPAGTVAAGRSGFRVLHAPSDPEAKGSAAIRLVAEELRGRGVPIDYVELHGVPHSEVVHQLAHADVVVDQLYSDTLLSGLASEAAAMGRPVIVGGYDLDLLDHALPPDLVAPVVRIHPEGLLTALEAQASDPGKSVQSGELSRAFVHDTQRPENVAGRFLRILDGHAPDAWWFDPLQIAAVHGFGLPAERARKNVASVLAAGGPAALCIRRNRRLRELLIAFAQGGP